MKPSVNTILDGRKDQVLVEDDRSILRKIYENSLILFIPGASNDI